MSDVDLEITREGGYSKVRVEHCGGEIWVEIIGPDTENHAGTWLTIDGARLLRDWLNANIKD